jgi:uncharacterized membrane protein YoaK (UPF0700 family)
VTEAQKVRVVRVAGRGRTRLSTGDVRDLLLVGLTVASGSVDAISFLALGKVFTAFMTGNVVFLGLAVAHANAPDAIRVALAVAAFAGGVFLSLRIVAPATGSELWPRRVTTALTVALAAQASFLGGWMLTAGRPSTAAGDLLVCLSALAMGMQSRAVQALRVTGVFTTAATATVIVLVNDLVGRAHSAEERLRYGGLLVGLLVGAAGGGFLVVHARSYAVLLPFVLTLLVVVAAWSSFGTSHQGNPDGDGR